MIQPESTNARFSGGPLDGETHLMAHRLPYVEMPGPGERFFARLHVDRPEGVPDHLLYELRGADAEDETLLYRCRADALAAGEETGPIVVVPPLDPAAGAPPAGASGPPTPRDAGTAEDPAAPDDAGAGA